MEMIYLKSQNSLPNPDNPRTITDKKFNQLVKSIKEFPQMLELRPLVVDENLMVLGGNMRLRACIEAGLETIPCVKVDELTEEQKKEFIIKDNIGYGEWNWDVLHQDWNIDLLEDWGMDTIKHDWNQLDFIEEQQAFPQENRDNKLTIILAEAFIPEREEVKNAINSWLSENYSGCEIK